MTAALQRRQLIEGVAFVGPEQGPPPAVLELLGMVWRRKGLVLVTALAALMLAVVALSQIPMRYVAVAEVLVEPNAPNVLAFDPVAPRRELADISPGSEVRMILSPEIFGRVVDRLRLVDDPEFRPETTAGIVAAAKEAVGGLLGWRAPVGYSDSAAEARMARAVAIRNLRRATVVFPLEKSRVVAVRVNSLSAAKAALIANALVDLHLRGRLEERRSSARRAVNWLETRLANLNDEARFAFARADAFRAGEAATASLTAEAATSLLRDLTGALANARADGLTVRAVALENATVRLRDDLGRIARIEAELARLNAEADAARAMQTAFQTRLAEARAQAGVQRLDARLVASASPPLRPASPNKTMILALALAGGLTLGAGLAAMAESHRAPFRTAREVEAALGLPVLASAPRAPGWRKRPVIHARQRPGSRLAEAVRELRGVFDLARRDGVAPRVVAIASARPGEGKSTLAALLAEACARSGRRTLLVDCDLRRPSVAKLYGLEGAEDVISVLEGEVTLAEAVRLDPETGLYVLTAQPSPAARSDLLVAPGFATLMGEARESFDAIILDTPPVLVLADARRVAAEADATVLAIRWAETPREDASAAARLLREAGANLVGAALTNAGRGADPRIDIAGGGARYGRFSEYFAD